MGLSLNGFLFLGFSHGPPVVWNASDLTVGLTRVKFRPPQSPSARRCHFQVSVPSN